MMKKTINYLLTTSTPDLNGEIKIATEPGSQPEE